jgi:hypothetical protein
MECSAECSKSLLLITLLLLQKNKTGSEGIFYCLVAHHQSSPSSAGDRLITSINYSMGSRERWLAGERNRGTDSGLVVFQTPKRG